METQISHIRISKSITLVTKSPYEWFFSENSSIRSLYNIMHRELAIVIPDADCHLNVKIKSKAFIPNEQTLLKEYEMFCNKVRIKNIFKTQK